ncbi:MAG: ribonuclease Y [Patescibacteria group bacterium]
MVITFQLTTIGILGILVGMGIGYMTRHLIASRRTLQAESRAQDIIVRAEQRSHELVLRAQQESIRILEEAKRDDQERRLRIAQLEASILHEEQNATSATQEAVALRDALRQERDALMQERRHYISALERASGLSSAAAQALLLERVQEHADEDLIMRMHALEQRSREVLEKKAQHILTSTIQRYAKSHIAELTTTTVQLPSDEVKGRLIGKEGRNIKTFERVAGVDLIVDDTPQTVVISGFDPYRRQVARIALEKLILDGRINPVRIEESVKLARDEVQEKIKEAGQAAILETGVGMMDPKLVALLGRLALRTSFGQNVLLHSIEMAHIAGMLAAELGGDALIAKRGALLHDIGKAVDHEVPGTHVDIGRKILQKFNIDQRVIHAMESHHEEYPYVTLESRIVQAADAISAARPGARRDTAEAYLKRMEDLERVAMTFQGVEKAYAVQAGRELRMFVHPREISDSAAVFLARDIAKKVEQEVKYPGEIKVTVIRETRAIEYAR